MCYLELENISKIYESGNEPVMAVSEVSLSVERGEFIAITGPSGCGKSTLLHIIGGLNQPSEGNVYVVLAWVAIPFVLQAKDFKNLINPGFLNPPAIHQGRQYEIFPGRQLRNEVIKLVHDSHSSPSIQRQSCCFLLIERSALSLIMPLSRLEQFCFSGMDYHRLQVQGKFIDSDEELYSRMERCIGDNLGDSQGDRLVGRLTYTRQVLQEWYSSMNGIHRAMNAVCTTLFFIAVLNVFSMMIFQYMERKIIVS